MTLIGKRSDDPVIARDLVIEKPQPFITEDTQEHKGNGEIGNLWRILDGCSEGWRKECFT